MEERSQRKSNDWRVKAANNPDYYLSTEDGQKELSDMIKAETEYLLQQITKSRQTIREIVWLSKYCEQCSYFTVGIRRYMKCQKMNVRIVLPFYGRPIWTITVRNSGKEESFVSEIDWNSKRFSISDMLIKETINRINNGYPYPCYEPRESYHQL